MGPESSQRITGLRNTNPLQSKPDLIPLPAGFQASFNLQLMPATTITAMAFEPSWGLVAAANNKGFVVANFLVKHTIVVHPTVTSDGIQSRSIGRWVWSKSCDCHMQNVFRVQLVYIHDTLTTHTILHRKTQHTQDINLGLLYMYIYSLPVGKRLIRQRVKSILCSGNGVIIYVFLVI